MLLKSEQSCAKLRVSAICTSQTIQSSIEYADTECVPARLEDGRMGEQARHSGPGIIIPQLEID